MSGCKGTKHNLDGHTIGPQFLLHEGVLYFGHHAAGQEPIFVSHLHIAHVPELSGDRAFNQVLGVDVHVYSGRGSRGRQRGDF